MRALAEHPITPDISPLLVPRPYRVVGKRDEAIDTVTLSVVPVDGPLPTFEPAQVGMLGAFGIGEAAISISSSVADRRHHDYTIRRAGPITNALVDTPIGGQITVRGPFGNVWPIDEVDTPDLAIVAGGLGIAPLRALIDRVISTLDRFERVAIVYGARTPGDLAYRSDLAAWAETDATVALSVDEADASWDGSVGVVTELLGDDGVDLDWANTTAFVCGPDVMMHFTAELLMRLGVPAARIWLTTERNMQCGNGLCGHCQLGPFIVCRDGPVVIYERIGPFHRVREL